MLYGYNSSLLYSQNQLSHQQNEDSHPIQHGVTFWANEHIVLSIKLLH